MKLVLNRFWIAIYFFFLLFGPKIGGYIDTAIIMGLITIFMHARKFGSIAIDTRVFKLVAVIILLAIYEILVGFFNDNFDIVFVGRMIRSAVSFISIRLFVEDNKEYNEEIIFQIIVYILIFHAIIVILTSTFFVSWQEVLRPFNAFATHARQYRSTGLMAGFDIAGILCVIGNMFVMSKPKFGFKECFEFIIFSVAVFFTSRFTLVLFSMVLISFLIINWKSKEKKLLRFMLIVILIFVILFAVTLLSMTTSNIFSNLFFLPKNFGWMSNIVNKVQMAYANSDIQLAIARNSHLPKNFWGILFGIGYYGGGDIGYVRIINAVGVLGLVLTMCWHVGVVYHCFKIKYKNKSKNRYKNFMMIVFSIVLIFLNFKNSYFFTGTFFEILLVVVFELEKEYYIEKNRNCYEQ